MHECYNKITYSMGYALLLLSNALTYKGYRLIHRFKLAVKLA